jgi:5-methylcytosine-specific restriction endonuclease McrA
MLTRRCIACSTLITTGSRCRACKPDRQTNGWRWSAVRRQVLARDGHTCRRCGANTRLEIHHVTPLRVGGSDDPANLATLCGPCHSRETLNFEDSNTRAPAQGIRIRDDSDARFRGAPDAA